MTTPAPANHSPTKRYLLGKRLGKGGMGSVYVAFDRLIRREVALKRVDLALNNLLNLSPHDMRLSLAREFELAHSLRHPNIIEVLDYGFDAEQRPYYTMELLRNAHNLLAAGRQRATPYKIDLLVQMLQALVYLHRRGILHRDLKPENVLVVGNQVKLLDFGLSVLHSTDTGNDADEVLSGTLTYMAPEVLAGQPVTVAADLYAVGVMAYELFSGSYPFAMQNTGTLIRDIIQKVPDVDALDVDDAVRAVVARLMHKQPQERYTDARATIEALRRAQGMNATLELTSIRESFLQAARLVGRDAELTLLNAALGQTLQGHGSTWLIAGESGVGKSRLIDELRMTALVRGAAVVRGQADSSGRQPFSLWLTVLRWLCLENDDLEDADVAWLKPFVPDIGALLGREVEHLQGLPPGNALTIRQRLLALTSRTLRQQKATVLIFEDLQWAGSESLGSLVELTEMIDSLPVLIIGSYRNDEAPTLFTRFQNSRLLHLDLLDEDATRQLSMAMLGPEGAHPELVDLLHRETEGNVFFIIEVVRALAEDVGQLDQIGRATLPAKVFVGGVETVIQRRLGHLATPDLAILRVAAVRGRQLDLPVLQHIFPHEDFNAWLTVCTNAAILESRDQVWYFVHEKLRTAVVNSLNADEQRLTHRRIAEALESIYGDELGRIAALAYHWSLAGDIEREEHYATLAGEQGLRIGAYREALSYFQRAKDLLDLRQVSRERKQRKQVHLSQRMGEAYTGFADYAMARRLFRASLMLCQQLNDDIGIAVSSQHLANVSLALGELADARQLLEKSLAIYQRNAHQAGVARTLNSLGDVAYEDGALDVAQRYYQQSLTLAREIGEDWGMAGALRTQQLRALHTPHNDTRQQAEARLAVQQADNDMPGMAATLLELADITRQANDAEAARHYANRSLELYRQLEQTDAQIKALTALARIGMAQGSVNENWAALRSALALAVSLEDVRPLLQTLLVIADWLAEQSDEARALALLASVLYAPQTPEDLQDPVEQRILALESRLDPTNAQSAWEAGKATSLQQVVDDMLS